MIRPILFSIMMLLMMPTAGIAQNVLQPGQWKGVLIREDQQEVVFLFRMLKNGDAYQMVVQNGAEELTVPQLTQKGDSLFFEMPFFESSFRVRIVQEGELQGIMTKLTSTNPQVWPFRAWLHRGERFPVAREPQFTITGRWAVTFTRPNQTQRPAVAEFEQQGHRLTGSFLTPSGDYRYLDGVVSGDSLYLSAFDGSHIYFFTARISSADMISGGWFYSGWNGKEFWQAQKNPAAALPDLGYTPSLKPGYDHITFSFPDLDSNLVSSTDARFKDKVVVVQLMGSWCPNCMDETAFLSDYYNRNKHRGVEVVALAYEYSTDFQRSRKSLIRFRDRFRVEYPMLISGVRVADSLRTEKTLPQLTAIKVFPTSLIIDKKGKVRKFETGFNGPGTGQHYKDYIKEFEATINELLAE